MNPQPKEESKPATLADVLALLNKCMKLPNGEPIADDNALQMLGVLVGHVDALNAENAKLKGENAQLRATLKMML